MPTKADCFHQNPPFPHLFTPPLPSPSLLSIPPSKSKKMLPLKLVRSLVMKEPISHFHTKDDPPPSSMTTTTSRTRARRARSRTPLLVFTPTTEIIHNTYRLSSIARDIGMDLYPNSSLSHIIFSWPTPSPPQLFPPSSSSSSSSSRPSFSSTISSSTPSVHNYSLPNGAVPLPFPTLTLASLSLLRYFVSISKGLFKLAFFDGDFRDEVGAGADTWDCSSLALVSRGTGFRVDSMDGFSRVLAGYGWTLFRTPRSHCCNSGEREFGGSGSVFLFRKVDANRVRSGEGRVRELRLPALDFKNVPLRILQYIVLMTDDIFFLA